MPSRGHLLEAVARSLADPIFVIDYNGCYVDVIGGSARGDYDSSHYLLGRYMHDVLPPEVADRFLALVREAIDRNCVKTTEFPLSSSDCDGNTQDGPSGVQWFEGRISPIQHERASMPPCVAWIVVNITRRKQLEERLKTLAETDELTGLYNRRVFLQRAAEELARGHRYGQPLHLALIDLDHFKLINDQFGHPVGDALLKHVSCQLQMQLRESDLLARIGGEEFAILLPSTGAEQAVELMRRLQAQIRAYPLDLHDTLLPITFSVGITGLQPLDQDPSDLLKRVDRMLYHAKNQGRNCICGPDHDIC